MLLRKTRGVLSCPGVPQAGSLVTLRMSCSVAPLFFSTFRDFECIDCRAVQSVSLWLSKVLPPSSVSSWMSPSTTEGVKLVWMGVGHNWQCCWPATPAKRGGVALRRCGRPQVLPLPIGARGIRCDGSVIAPSDESTTASPRAQYPVPTPGFQQSCFRMSTVSRMHARHAMKTRKNSPVRRMALCRCHGGSTCWAVESRTSSNRVTRKTC
jgi:hypothetical protein